MYTSAYLDSASEWWLTAPEAMAYATYVFSTDGADPAPVVYCSFDLRYVQAPTSHSQLWLGLANWENDRWDWYAMAGAECRLNSLTPYLDSQGRLMLTAAVLGPRCTLYWLRLGDALPIEAALEVSPAWGHAPLDVALTARVENLNWHGVCRYQWDWDGDGAYDAESATPEVEHSYTDAGVYSATVRITDVERVSATATATIDCFSWDPIELVPGMDPVLFDLNGKPAIIYLNYEPEYSPSRRDIRMIVAEEADGKHWREPTDIVSVGRDYLLTIEDCGVINGLPAVCYTAEDATYQYKHYYTTALNADGSEWSTPSEIMQHAQYGEYYSQFSLAEVDGRPAVSFAGYTISDPWRLRFMRASDSLGVFWPEPQVLDGDVIAGPNSDLIVAGFMPAIAYASGEGISYIVARDSNGREWNESVRVDPELDNVYYPPPLNCAYINDRPVIVYGYRAIGTDQNWYYMYAGATHVQGLTWDKPVAFGGAGCSLAQPGFAYDDHDLFVAYWADFEPHGFRPSIYYVKGTFPAGDAWAQPCEVYPDFTFGAWEINTPSPIAVVSGRLCAVISAAVVRDADPMIYTSRSLR